MHISRFVNLSGAIFVASFAALSVPSSALGSNVKIEDGAGCLGFRPSDEAKIAYRDGFGIKAVYTTTGPAVVHCPLTKDNTTTTSGLEDLEISVSNPSGTLFCSAGSADRYGNTLQSDTEVAAAGNNKVINFGSAINLSDSKGSYSAVCYLGNGDRVHSIYVREY